MNRILRSHLKSFKSSILEQNANTRQNTSFILRNPHIEFSFAATTAFGSLPWSKTKPETKEDNSSPFRKAKGKGRDNGGTEYPKQEGSLKLVLGFGTTSILLSSTAALLLATTPGK
jgi:hypothetical protein